MARPLKPKLELYQQLGPNPFTDGLSIQVTHYDQPHMYRKDEEQELVPCSHTVEQEVPVKLYINAVRRLQAFNLSDKAMRLFVWVLYEMESNKDYLWLNKDRYMSEDRIKSLNTYKAAIAELIRYEYLLPTLLKDTYWLNPSHFFRGNRMKMYPKNLSVHADRRLK